MKELDKKELDMNELDNAAGGWIGIDKGDLIEIRMNLADKMAMQYT